VVLPFGDDLVNDLDRGISFSLGLADLLWVAAALLDEVLT